MTDRPNIVLFMPETLRADAVFGDQAGRALTPNMDALGEEGVCFDRCYAQHSVCSPSRCSMFTGLYPHTAGRRTLGTLIRPHEHNLFRELRDAGYETVVFGKNDMMFPETARLSFDRWQTEDGHRPNPDHQPPYPHAEGDRLFYSFMGGKVGTDDGACHDGDWAGVQNALDYIAEDHDKPFCLLIVLSYVHPPYVAPEPFYSMYDRAKMPPGIQADRSRKRRYATMIHENYGLDKLTDEEWREIRALYFAMTSRVDDQLGQVVAKLKECNLWDETAVLSFSDHGDFCGDYGLVEKWFSACEDVILRTPFHMRVPGRPAIGLRQAMIEMVDLYPTVLDIAGVEDRHTHFGKSLLRLCDAAAEDKHREVVFSEGGHNPDEAHIHDIACPYGGVYYQKHHQWAVDPLVMSKAWMARDEQYKFIYCPDEFDELYDMTADPGETVNLADDPAMADVVRRMRDRLLEWLSRTADHIPEDEDRCGWPN
jgi:arylsulfatase A-like enzyme